MFIVIIIITLLTERVAQLDSSCTLQVVNHCYPFITLEKFPNYYLTVTLMLKDRNHSENLRPK